MIGHLRNSIATIGGLSVLRRCHFTGTHLRPQMVHTRPSLSAQKKASQMPGTFKRNTTRGLHARQMPRKVPRMSRFFFRAVEAFDCFGSTLTVSTAMKAVMQECCDGALKYKMEKSIINQDITLKKIKPCPTQLPFVGLIHPFI